MRVQSCIVTARDALLAAESGKALVYPGVMGWTVQTRQIRVLVSVSPSEVA